MLYLQQITGYVDTKDRGAAGGALVLNASLSGMAENLDKRWESLGVRDQRADAARRPRRRTRRAARLDRRRAAGLALAEAGARAPAVRARRRSRRARAAGVEGARERSDQAVRTSRVCHPTFRTLDSYKYVGFEDQFRGSREAIRARLESYLPFFARQRTPTCSTSAAGAASSSSCSPAPASPRAASTSITRWPRSAARAASTSPKPTPSATSRRCRTRSLGGLFAAQVVEHLQPAYLLRFLELAFHKLRPGGRVVLETLNPACWVAFFDSYIRDITHVWPLHPDTLKYLVLASGFTRRRSRVPIAGRARRSPAAVALPAGADAGWRTSSKRSTPTSRS